METGPYSEWSQGYLDGHNAALNARESCDESNKFIVSLDLDASAIDEAQQKADKLKATLLEVQELIRKIDMEAVVPQVEEFFNVLQRIFDAQKKPPRLERREVRFTSNRRWSASK